MSGETLAVICFAYGAVLGVSLAGIAVGKGPFWDGFREGFNPLFWFKWIVRR